jgi:Bacterial low temperature requirement A protein (LtrA)
VSGEWERIGQVPPQSLARSCLVTLAEAPRVIPFRSCASSLSERPLRNGGRSSSEPPSVRSCRTPFGRADLPRRAARTRGSLSRSVLTDDVTGDVASADDERRTSYLELFFDLVFVFAITQVTSLVLSDTSPAGFARSLLITGLLWWAWSGFAWMTNAIDIDDRLTQLTMVLAMAAAFMAAFAIPGAFDENGDWFGASFLALASSSTSVGPGATAI